MDVVTLAQGVVTFLTPILPYLLSPTAKNGIQKAGVKPSDISVSSGSSTVSRPSNQRNTQGMNVIRYWLIS